MALIWAGRGHLPGQQGRGWPGLAGRKHGALMVSVSGCVDPASLLLLAFSAVLYSPLELCPEAGVRAGHWVVCQGCLGLIRLSSGQPKPQRRLWLELWAPWAGPRRMERARLN